MAPDSWGFLKLHREVCEVKTISITILRCYLPSFLGWYLSWWWKSNGGWNCLYPPQIKAYMSSRTGHHCVLRHHIRAVGKQQPGCSQADLWSKQKTCIQCVCYILKYSDCLQEKHLCDWIVSHTNCLFLATPSSFERMTDKLWLFSVDYLATFSQKWIKCVWHLKENNWQDLLLVMKFELSSEN